MSKELQKLIFGYQKFKEKYFNDPNYTEFDELVRVGQKPKILMIACSDSRVDPAIVTKSKPGEIFVIRNVANLVPPYESDTNTYHGTSAALEFGVCNLEVEHIIVFGHTQCGGINALVENSKNIIETKGFVSKWMELAKPACDIVINQHPNKPFEEKTFLCGEYSLINSIQNLLTFPWIRQKVEAGGLQLHAWYFELETGTIYSFDKEKENFKELV